MSEKQSLADASMMPLEEAGKASEPAVPQFVTQFASMSLHMSDRVRFLNFPPELPASIEGVFTAHWPTGIQYKQNYGGSYEFKLRGRPWTGHGSDAITARRLMCRLLEALYDSGWVLAFATDISKKPEDKDTLIFRLQNPIPAPRSWAAISFSNTDKIRLIDAPDELVQSVVSTYSDMGVVQRHGPYFLEGAYELKLRGRPWWSSGEETMTARRWLLILLAVLETHGYTCYASIDQKAGSAESGDTDTWHICRPQTWTPGLPVFHG